MNMTKLSVSSVILAAVLSGCSQQQVVGGSQVVNGSGGSQIAGSSQSQIEGGSQVSGSQQQVEGTVPVIAPAPVYKPAPKVAVKPAIKRAPVRVYNKPIVKRVASKPKMTRSIQRGTGLPPAKPGQCFAKVKQAPKYVTKSKRVLIQKASQKRVLVRAPQYRWVAKKVLVRKAQYINRTIPAVYRNQSKRVQVRPAYHTWKKGHGAITRIDNMTGEIMCRVTVPAQYKTVNKRVLVRPAQNARKFIPAVYKTVKQKQRVSGALYKTVKRPARYATKNYRVQVAGAKYVWRPVLCATNAPKHHKYKAKYRKPAAIHRPVKRAVHRKQYNRPAAGNGGISYAQYLAVMNAPLKSKASKKKRVKKKAAKKMMPKKLMPKKVKATAMPEEQAVKMAPLVKDAPKVETKATETKKPAKNKAQIQRNIVYGIQAALKSKGYNPGALDGKMGPNTAAALKAFQSSRGLPVGVLSKDTFRALGLVK